MVHIGDHLKTVFAAPAFPVPAFPNGYPGYPMRGDSSQPSLADDHGHSLMGLEDQVTPVHPRYSKSSLIYEFYIDKNDVSPKE